MTRRLALLAGVFLLLYFVTPPYVPTCPFRGLTGLPCPLCGLTRAMFLLAKGHVAEALALHPFSPLAAGFAIAAALQGEPPLRKAWPWLIACLLVFGVARLAVVALTL